MFLPECTDYEVGDIISQLQNGKSSDFPMREIKKIISCFNCAIPSCLKTGEITPIKTWLKVSDSCYSSLSETTKFRGNLDEDSTAP